MHRLPKTASIMPARWSTDRVLQDRGAVTSGAVRPPLAVAGAPGSAHRPIGACLTQAGPVDALSPQATPGSAMSCGDHLGIRCPRPGVQGRQPDWRAPAVVMVPGSLDSSCWATAVGRIRRRSLWCGPKAGRRRERGRSALRACGRRTGSGWCPGWSRSCRSCGCRQAGRPACRASGGGCSPRTRKSACRSGAGVPANSR